jgi:pimeloyl-ACP methyl ester carboxylesterase
MTPGQMIRSCHHVTGPWQHKTLEGGHWLPLETPQAVNETVLAWLRSVR